MTTKRIFRVLSFDGGGMRGIYASAFLYKMQSNVLKQPFPLEGKDPNDELDVARAFDLIVGTNSGSIIGCGLASGIPVSRIAEAFKVFGDKVFPNPVPSQSQDGLNFIFKLLCDILNRKKNLLDGEKALVSELEKVFQNETLGDLWHRRQIALAVPSIHMANHQAWVFKTPHLNGTNHRDDGYKLWEVCLASSAAPVFRALANIGDPNSEDRKTHKTFVDGGLVANNPVLGALWDSLEMTNEGDAIEVYCLGTNPPQGGDIVDFNDNAWSYLEWQGGAKVVEVSLNAQQTLHHYMAFTFAKHFKRDCRIYRFPTTPLSPDVSSFTGLDKVSSRAVNALTALAEADADKVNRMMNDASCPQGQAFSNIFSSIKPSTNGRGRVQVMFDFHKAITAFHDDSVTLPQSLRDEMRQRRDSNRKRLERGLEKHNRPKPYDSITQGSYAMKTMIQAADNDYDIDDGIYFQRSQLKTRQDNDASALTVRQMICEALSDERFNDPPEVKTNCVRVNYGAGYHVDIPIYRADESGNNPELASADWIVSNARDVKAWFDRENQSKSLDTQNGRQLRRIVRLFKRFAKSRESWKDTLPSGFALTILVCEQFQPCLNSDDISFYNTLFNIHKRLNQYLDIWHPTTPNTLVNTGVSDAKTSNLKDRLYENLLHLQVTLSDECSQDDAVKAWGKVFHTDYFTEYTSRNLSTIAVAEASFLPSRYNNSPLPPPNLWNGQAGVSIVKNQGVSVLS